MAETNNESSECEPKTDLREPRRFITTNNTKGKAVFYNILSLSEIPPIRELGGGVRIALNYATTTMPANFSKENDIAEYENLLRNPLPGISIPPDGCVARLIDFPPGYTSPMHRTISLNYNFVISGEVELILDSGETRNLLPGDMAVQRAVNHCWRNVSSTSWARITAFAISAITDQTRGDAETEPKYF